MHTFTHTKHARRQAAGACNVCGELTFSSGDRLVTTCGRASFTFRPLPASTYKRDRVTIKACAVLCVMQQQQQALALHRHGKYLTLLTSSGQGFAWLACFVLAEQVVSARSTLSAWTLPGRRILPGRASCLLVSAFLP